MFGSWYNTSRLHFVTVAPDVLRTLVTTTATREIHRVHFSAIEYSVFSLTNCHCQLHARVNPQKDVSPNQAESFGNALRYRLSPGGTRHELFFWHQTTAARCRKQELSSIMTLSPHILEEYLRTHTMGALQALCMLTHIQTQEDL